MAEDAGALYRTAKPFLDEALKAYERKVRDLLEGQVQDFYVTGRVKSARSLIRKMRSKPGDSALWDAISDKVGVRVICTTLKDCKRVDSVLWGSAGWERVSRDVKSGEFDQLFYPGTHLIVKTADVVDHRNEPIPCEVQIRTRAQDAWSVASHKLLYKGTITPPRRMQRVIQRLTVVVEMFDEEVQRMFSKRKKLPMYDVARVLEEVELAYENLTGEPNDGASDLHIMQQLLPAYEDQSKARSLVTEYCDGNQGRLASLIAEHLPEKEGYNDSRDWLYSYPEVLVILERASARPFMLASTIQDTDLEDVVRRTCITAGVTLPGS